MGTQSGRTSQRDLVLQALEAVSASGPLTGATRQQRLLRFLVERTLSGQGDDLKEYVLALEVFDRPSSFNPREDSIVRVEVRKLRENLTKYYATAGKLDPIRITLPKGRYVAVFEEGAATDASPVPAVTRRPVSKLAAAAGVILLVAIASALYVYSRPGPVPIAARERSLAVLPFANLDGDPADGYFADGLTEEVIHVLSSVEGLRVVARTSILGYKNQPRDLRQIGEKLHVTEILEGSVRKTNGRWRATAQLISVPSGFHLWSKVYDRPEGDAVVLQEDIARAVLHTLKQQTPAPDEQRLISLSVNSAAYQVFLHGMYSSDRSSREGLEKSLGDFHRAIELDESFGPAYTALAASYIALSIYGFWPPNEAIPRAREAATRAESLDARFGDAHAMLGFIAAVYDWNWPEAEREFTRSIALGPNCATCRAWYSLYCLAPLQKAQQAEEEINRAVSLDPLDGNFQSFRMAIPLYTGQYDLAIERSKQSIDLSGQVFIAHVFLAAALRHQGRLAEALESARRAADLSGNNPIALRLLAEIHGAMGNRKEVLAIRDRLLEESHRRYISSSALFHVYRALGDRDAAFAWLRKAAEEHDSYLIFMRAWTLDDQIRRDPRFREVQRKVGLL